MHHHRGAARAAPTRRHSSSYAAESHVFSGQKHGLGTSPRPPEARPENAAALRAVRAPRQRAVRSARWQSEPKRPSDGLFARR